MLFSNISSNPINSQGICDVTLSTGKVQIEEKVEAFNGRNWEYRVQEAV